MSTNARAAVVEALNGEFKSPLLGVSNQAWNRFVVALMIDDDRGSRHGRPRPFNAKTHAGGVGCFGMMPRRLVEIGVLKAVIVVKGRVVADPTDPRLIAFIANPIEEQYKAFVTSLRLYTLDQTPLPEGMTRSGALALRHRLGPNALVKWSQHQEPSTTALFQRTNGLF